MCETLGRLWWKLLATLENNSYQQGFLEKSSSSPLENLKILLTSWISRIIGRPCWIMVEFQLYRDHWARDIWTKGASEDAPYVEISRVYGPSVRLFLTHVCVIVRKSYIYVCVHAWSHLSFPLPHPQSVRGKGLVRAPLPSKGGTPP